MPEKSLSPLPDIRKVVVFNTPVEKVWKGVATSEGLAAWWMPNNFKPVPLQEFYVDDGRFHANCKVMEIEPPRRLVFSFGKDWHISFELKDIGGKTEFTLVHSGWDANKVTEFGQPHTIIREVMDRGWGDLQKLHRYVEA
jgi:uncharacterized protein YndB with AHSA1/START domain